MKTAVALNTSANNQSMSLTRNTSQLRTSNLLSSEESKKHTNSQTIHVEKTEGGKNPQVKQKEKLGALHEKTPSKSQLKEVQQQ